MAEDEHKNITIDGQKVSMGVCLERIHSNIALLALKVDSKFSAVNLRLDGLNSFKKKCESNTKEHATDFKAHEGKFQILENEFKLCHNSHETEDITKSKISSKTIAIGAVVIALGTLLVGILWK